MKRPVVALVWAAVLGLGLALPLLATAGGGGGGGGRGGPPGTWAGQGHRGGGVVVVRPGHPGAWRGGFWGPRVGVVGGPWFWGGWPGAWGPWPGAWGAWPGGWGASVAFPVNVAPIVINSTPQTQLFMQQEPAAPAAPAAAQVTPEVSYWYYCIQPAGYFPYVKDCNEPWLKVVPQAPGEQPSAPRLAP